MPHPSPQTLEQIKTLLRRDLKLGTDFEIPDDMPFFGSDIDLDSLDILLLMTSIEKQFKIKIPSEAVGRQVFQSLATLASYVEEHASPGAAASAKGKDETAASIPGGGRGPDQAELLGRLPHAPPFRFITRITSVKQGESGEGVWAVNGQEAFFAGHFPGNPIVPGVLIAEALAQLSGLVGSTGVGQGGKLAHVDVRFEAPVKPPAQIILRSRLTRTMEALQQFEVSASVNERIVAQGTLSLHRDLAQK